MSLPDWLTSRIQESPQNIALIIDDDQWTYAELNRLVNGLCARLMDEGITSGQHVGVLLPNNLAYVCLIHALARLSVVLVPLNIRLTANELAWQIKQADCTLVITNSNEPLAISTKQLAISNDDIPSRDSFPIHPSSFNIQNVQAIVFTSGTTGKPKGAMVTFANHYHSAMASAERIGVQADDRWLSVLPLYHVGGLAVIWRSCLYGTAVVLHKRFKLDKINYSLDHDQPTLISLVPTMLHRLIESRTQWPESLRLILLGGAAAHPDLIHRANTLSLHIPLVATTYGLTEAASQVATMLPDEVIKKPGSVGKPLKGTAVAIVNQQNQKLSAGEVGEIVVSGPTVMAGYYRNQKATFLRLHGDELYTGDMGYLDEDGDLWVIQRRSDLIVTGGENVYPAEVEAVLVSHPAVKAACVVGVVDLEWGQKVTAMVQLEEGQSLTEEALLAFSYERLAGYKQPRLLQFVTELPLTASGKIARKVIAEQMANLA